MLKRGIGYLAVAAAFALGACGGIGGGKGGEGEVRFSAEQAERGEKLFAASCAGCHSVDAGVDAPQGLAGERFVARWASVNDLYSVIRNTMPADKVLSLKEDELRDVTAYILKVNGFAAGAHELGPDRSAMRGMLLRPSGDGAGGEPGKQAVRGVDQGYFSAAQAQRGANYFAGSCSTCHVAGPKIAKPGETLDPTFANISMVETGGVTMGPLRAKSHLAGPGIMEQWSNVGAFYRRVRDTMPGHDPRGLNEQTYRDIVAYLLSLNGYKPGAADLPTDERLLDAMPLIEPGFAPLGNGRDFSGWKFLIGMGCRPEPEGCGSTKPGDTFSIADGVISTTGHPHGYMYTEGKYLNFTLRFEYRLRPDKGARPEDVYYGNSGYLLFVTDHVVWPKSIEIEALDPIQLRPLGLATMPDYDFDDAAMRRARRPTGQWNGVEIRSAGGQITMKLNGTLVATIRRHEFTAPGHIAFQAEGGAISWRNLRIRKE